MLGWPLRGVFASACASVSCSAVLRALLAAAHSQSLSELRMPAVQGLQADFLLSFNRQEELYGQAPGCRGDWLLGGPPAEKALLR